ncbi:tyrosine-protein phosphatase [Xylocopilactobacillus apicola]|uniref:Protein-tyrosine-phosphatase n=1 Tax=Xylocopilactobacillus apicola TaxID=2932184 RepID=A0AAU9DIA6_9LACO|nr:tyrosine-protein phosphatase [Xylocopilactobacillus apicola]BDR58096.1 protein-tyrosine-phosphatase [Xylocopilactobacillus apicola]
MNRIIPLRFGRNIRELGGYKTIEGRQIKWKKLIRSAKLSELDDQDLSFLEHYGVKTVIDFRSTDEIKEEPDPPNFKVQLFVNPVLKRDETKNSKTPAELQEELMNNSVAGIERMKNVYRKMVTSETSKKAFQHFFEILLTKGAHGIIFHCTSGKDRTGLASIYLLSALGVLESDYKKDYLLTNEIMSKYVNNIIEALRQKGQPNIFINNIKALYTVNLAYYLEAMKWIVKLAGSTDNYLHEELKLSPVDLNDLKHLFLSD